jgi:lipopolysaccharide transport system permease protein
MGSNLATKAEVDITAVPVTDIAPPRGWIPVNLRELWSHRELLYFFVWRDLKVRYRQTVLGFAWAIIAPLVMMIVFSLFFGTLVKVPSENIPYPLFNFSALLPWNLFAACIGRASYSLLSDANLIQKVYFPRLLLPLAGVLSPLVDFAIGFLILIGLMFYYSHHPGITVFWLLAFTLLAVMLALGVGLWLSAINVKYRDIGQLIPFLVQLWFFASPVIYGTTMLPQRFQFIYGLNPMVGVLEGFRWALLGTERPTYILIYSTAITIAILISGVFYFRRRENAFADVL